MTIFQGLLLGVVQGVAEFLPISSSAHLLLAEHFLNVEFLPLAFSVFLHLATLLAVVIFFRKHIAELFFALGRIVFRKPILENYTGSTSFTKTDVCARSSVVAIFIITFVTGCKKDSSKCFSSYDVFGFYCNFSSSNYFSHCRKKVFEKC